VSAVRAFSVFDGSISDPNPIFRAPRVAYMMRAIRTLSSPSSRIRLPITLWLFRRIIFFLLSDPTDDNITMAAVCSLAFYGLFRIGELLPKSSISLGLTTSEIRFLSRLLLIHLPASKGDVFRDGVTVRVPATGDFTCPHALLRRILITLRSSGRTGSNVFYCKNRPLTAAVFNKRLRIIIAELGCRPSEYSSHSFRKGMATTLAVLGFPASLIRTLGRWKSLSYQLYVKVPDSQIVSVAHRLSSSPSSSVLFGGGFTSDSTQIFRPSASCDLESIQVAFSGRMIASQSHR
jgi:hypothetical protein